MTTIKLKNGSGAPTAGDLAQGEPALDLTNKRLYTEDSLGAVIEVGTNPGVNVTFADNRKAIFGAGSDLQIYHDGNHSYVSDQGTGSLFLRSGNTVFIQNAGGTANYFKGTDGGAAELFHNGSATLATTSTGIDVTGSVISDGLTVDGNPVINGTSPQLFLQTGASNYNWQIAAQENVSDAFEISSGSADANATNDTYTKRLVIQQSGDISFYEDTGTTAKLFWDASAESLGIGTSSPIAASGYANLTLNGNTGGQLHFTDNDVKKATIASSVDDLYVQSGAQTIFRNGGFASGNEAMRIDSSGNLLVGTTSSSGASAPDNSGTASDAGIRLSPTGFIGLGANQAPSGYFNRIGNDGDIIKFNKDGTAVGSIGTKLSDGGTSDGELFITSGNTGLFFDDIGSYIRPCNGSAALRDNTVDLGKSDSRFKDLYLSGGVYLGGTGSANQLDDYEEGTFTPTLGGGTSFGTTTYTTQTGTYTKIGDTVHVRIYLDVSATTGSGFLKIGGIPFTVASLGSIGAFLPSGLNWGGGSYLQSYATGGDAFLRVYYASDNANWQAQQVTNETQQMLITIAYQAA